MDIFFPLLKKRNKVNGDGIFLVYKNKNILGGGDGVFFMSEENEVFFVWLW